MFGKSSCLLRIVTKLISRYPLHWSHFYCILWLYLVPSFEYVKFSSNFLPVSKHRQNKNKIFLNRKLGQTQVNVSSKQGRLSRQIHCYSFFPMRNWSWVGFESSLFAPVFAPFFFFLLLSLVFLEEGFADRSFLDLTCRAHASEISVAHVTIDSFHGGDISFLRPSLFLWRLRQNIGRFTFFFSPEFSPLPRTAAS